MSDNVRNCLDEFVKKISSENYSMNWIGDSDIKKHFVRYYLHRFCKKKTLTDDLN